MRPGTQEGKRLCPYMYVLFKPNTTVGNEFPSTDIIQSTNTFLHTFLLSTLYKKQD